MSDDVVAKVLALVLRTDANGNARYVTGEIRHIVPLIVLEVGMDLAKLPDKVRAIVDEVAASAGVAPGMGADAVIEKLRAFYEKFPPNPQLLADIAGVLRESLTQGGTQTGAMAAVLGQEKVTGVLGGGERPKGTVPGGIAAQLAALSSPKKKPPR